MSGSGGGNSFESGPSKDCNTLTIITQLASPVPAVIATLKSADILEIILTPPAGPVQAITSGNSVAGAILSKDIAQLIICMSEGHEYKAKILEIKGGNCQILITHK